MVSLEVKGLRTGYGKILVIKKIDFSMSPGDFIGVIGPNGCGKSTLLRAVTGVLPIWGGKVYLDGIDITTLDPRGLAKKIAVVPQRTQISFPYTVREVVEMGRTPYLRKFETPRGEHSRVVNEALDKVNIRDIQDRTVRELSGGEYQRMLIARALTQEPELMLLDEATSQLDIGHRIEVMDLMKSLNQREGLTLMTIHHDLDLAARYCEEIIMMDKGRVRAHGSPSEVLTPPHLRAVYGIEAEVRRNPKDDTLYVVPVRKDKVTSTNGVRVHLICGGGSGANVMKRLVEKGYDVSAGVLNAMDTDLEAAKFLDVPAVVEAPFSNISEEKGDEVLQVLRDADVVVLTSFPVGVGNLKNLEIALQCADEQKNVIVMGGDYVEKRDHTGGRAVDIYHEIKERISVKSVEDVRELMVVLEQGYDRL
ncbi:MAG: ABC transporter ATP-binding protein [Thermoplasmata archaeon]